MHSQHWMDDRYAYSINYNSDLSGDVIITKTDFTVPAESRLSEEIEVPGEILIDLIGFHVSHQRASQLDSMEAREVLGLKPKTGEREVRRV